MHTFPVSKAVAALALLLSPLAWCQTPAVQALASVQVKAEAWSAESTAHAFATGAPKQRQMEADGAPMDKAWPALEPGAVLRRTGAGVTVFIIDTGIRADHSEFGGRVLPGFSVIHDGKGTSDCNGHGTHVAGIVGGRQLGVAKQVMLVPVRVMDCAGAGTANGLISALEWVGNTTQRPAVANLSVGGIASAAVNAAVAALVAKGVTVVVAAGNHSVDACKASPASAPHVIIVGATNGEGSLASYSNFGPCVTVFAQGSEVVSAWHTSDIATQTLTGTSMASPAVAGLAALTLETYPQASPQEVGTFLVDQAGHNRAGQASTSTPWSLIAWMTGALAGSAQTQTLAVKAMATLSTQPRTMAR